MPAEKLRAVLLFGMPGAGKGTQGKILGQVPGFVHCSSGEIFRSLDKESALGQEVARYTSQGALVPDDVTIRVWRWSMDAAIDRGDFNPAEELLVLDGIPRTVRQSEILQKHVEVLGVIHLFCSDEDAMVQRLRGRALKEDRTDDADEEVIRKRFEVYRAETAPVLGFYPSELVAEIDAAGTPVEVLLRILQALVPIQSAQFSGTV